MVIVGGLKRKKCYVFMIFTEKSSLNTLAKKIMPLTASKSMSYIDLPEKRRINTFSTTPADAGKSIVIVREDITGNEPQRRE